MKKLLALLLTLLLMLPLLSASAEALTLEGTVECVQSLPIFSLAKGNVNEIRCAVGDRVTQDRCIVTVTTTKVYAPVTGKVWLWGSAGDKMDELTAQYGAAAYIEPSQPYTIKTRAVDANGRAAEAHPGQRVYLICMTDGKKTGEGVITAVSGGEFTVQVEQSNFEDSDVISIYTTADHAASNRIGRGNLTRAGISACGGTGYIVRTHVKSGDAVRKGDLMYETVEGGFLPGAARLDEIAVPEDGVIAEMKVGRGQEMDDKTVVALLYPDAQMRVRALAPESALSDYRVGDTVYITGQSGEIWTGIIEKISQIPEESENPYDRFYPLYITVAEKAGLYYGMNVAVSREQPPENGEINE